LKANNIPTAEVIQYLREGFVSSVITYLKELH